MAPAYPKTDSEADSLRPYLQSRIRLRSFRWHHRVKLRVGITRRLFICFAILLV